jgi:MOSC domain-containing protein YiiM
MMVQELFISPGHNYFGNHGQPPGEHVLVEVDAVECVARHGIRGDRFFDYQANYKGQITFFSIEVFRDVCKLLGVEDRSPGAARRNVVTRGIDLNYLVGRRFMLQGIEFEGVCECKPCYWMDSAIGPGAEQALQGRGGLRARILSDGVLHLSE